MHNVLRIAAPLLTLIALLAACAATPLASNENDADAKRFETAANAAIIYLYRPTGYGGHGVSTLWVDGKLVGETLPGTFFRIAVRPGRNRVTAGGGDMGRIDIDTKADGVYFIETQVAGETQSESATTFRAVAADVGKSTVQGCCRMLETWRPGQWRLNY
jgi:hypothetical protein